MKTYNLKAELRKTLREPAMAQSLTKSGRSAVANTAAEFSKRLR